MFNFGANSAPRKPLVVKKTTVTVKSTKPSSQTLSNNAYPKAPKSVGKFLKKQQPHQRDSLPTPPAERKSSQLKRKRPDKDSPAPVDFGASDEDSPEESVKHNVKRQVTTLDPDRQVRSREAFSDKNGGAFPMIHASEIPALDQSVKYKSIIYGLSPEETALELQYPSNSQRERYTLVQGQSDEEAFNAVSDITEVMSHVVKYYLPESEQEQFDNENTGFPQRLRRAVKKQDEVEVRKVIDEWNTAIVRLRDTGTISTTMDSLHSIDTDLVSRILNQAHARTVSPCNKVLHQYEAWSNNVYGELLPRFVSQILKRDIAMTSDQVFVDMGSGVGNVVLQAALEIGCEAWGCEMMDKYCDLADAQQAEFAARCRLWGLNMGAARLERGDFLTNATIAGVLKRADVVLVNNQVFSSQLNDSLMTLFLDLKDGCKIVSLKSFVPDGHKISARNLNAPYNVLEVRRMEYFSHSVNWTNGAGNYFVATKDSSRIARECKRLGIRQS